jgi:1,2-dihydroxy-3-keto-5-methylthiopentene dioxygenase
MAVITIPKTNKSITTINEIKAFLLQRGIKVDQWHANQKLSDQSSQEEILKAYEHALTPFMQANNFKTADVISVNPQTPNIDAIRKKFLQEHTHSEDEVRFFVDGEGFFWFNLDNDDDVFCVHCVKGDFLSVPAGFKHWFDLAPKYTVKAIRIFTNIEGWVPNYTQSGIEKTYLSNEL